MFNLLNIVEALYVKPTQTLLAITMACVITLGVWAITAELAHAEIRKDQEVSNKYHDRQDKIFEMIVRIDEYITNQKHHAHTKGSENED